MKHRQGTHQAGLGLFLLTLPLVAMNTNKRVMWWFCMQMIMLGAVCYWQIRSLKSFFETRRLV